MILGSLVEPCCVCSGLLKAPREKTSPVALEATIQPSEPGGNGCVVPSGHQGAEAVRRGPCLRLGEQDWADIRRGGLWLAVGRTGRDAPCSSEGPRGTALCFRSLGKLMRTMLRFSGCYSRLGTQGPKLQTNPSRLPCSEVLQV